MNRSKQLKTYAITAALGLAATIGLFAYEGASTAQADAKGQNQSTSLKVAKIEFPGKNIDDMQWTSMAAPLQTGFKFYDLSGLTEQNLAYTSTNAYAQAYADYWSQKPKFSMQLGKGWQPSEYAVGSITFNFSSFSYQSIRIAARAKENKNLLINGKSYAVSKGWSDIDIYNCGVNSSDPLTITSTIGSDPFTWISSIELHYKG
jgi:hypothetical protein